MCVYLCREINRQKDISKGQRYQRNSRNHVRNTRDMNKNNFDTFALLICLSVCLSLGIDIHTHEYIHTYTER